MARFRRRGGSVELRASAAEARALSALVGDLLRLLEAGRSDVSPTGDAPPTPQDDPLAALVGLSDVPVGRPSDPALARLFPDAYRDDEERAAEFRRYTAGDLRATKRESGEAVQDLLAPLADGAGSVRLDDQAAHALLGSLNDLRLVLGTRLEVSQDWPEQVAGLDDDDPRLPAFSLYEALTAMQDSLVRVMLR